MNSQNCDTNADVIEDSNGQPEGHSLVLETKDYVFVSLVTHLNSKNNVCNCKPCRSPIHTGKCESFNF